MLSTEQLAGFLAASVLLTISPGPDVLATISIGLSRGWRAAVSFGCGCGTGCLLHTGLAVVGAAAALRSSPIAFTILKFVGGGYLATLGWGALRSSFSTPSSSGAVSEASDVEVEQRRDIVSRQYFARGLLANATNPKVALFFLAFLPQFVRSGQTSGEIQLAMLGGLFTAQAIFIFAAIGFFSGQVGQLLTSRPAISRWLDRLCGLLFLALAVLMLI